MKFVVLLLAVLGVACSAAPPETGTIEPSVQTRFGIDPSFTADQVEVIRDAVQAWCESSRNFCPVEVAWGANPDARIFRAQDYAAFQRPDHSLAWTNAERTETQVSPAATTDLHVFWRVIAHEFGHLSGLEHGEGGLELMAKHPDPYGPLAIE